MACVAKVDVIEGSFYLDANLALCIFPIDGKLP